MMIILLDAEKELNTLFLMTCAQRRQQNYIDKSKLFVFYVLNTRQGEIMQVKAREEGLILADTLN